MAFQAPNGRFIAYAPVTGVGVQNKRQMRCGITYSDDMRRLFVGTNMTKEVTLLNEDLGQIWTVE